MLLVVKFPLPPSQPCTPYNVLRMMRLEVTMGLPENKIQSRVHNLMIGKQSILHQLQDLLLGDIRGRYPHSVKLSI